MEVHVSPTAVAGSDFGYVLLHDGREVDVPDFFDPTGALVVACGGGSWWQLSAPIPGSGEFQVVVTVKDAEPPLAASAREVVEFSLDLVTDRVTLYSWEGEELLSVLVRPGWHRCRYIIGSGGRLRIQLWPDPPRDALVIRADGSWLRQALDLAADGVAEVAAKIDALPDPDAYQALRALVVASVEVSGLVDDGSIEAVLRMFDDGRASGDLGEGPWRAWDHSIAEMHYRGAKMPVWSLSAFALDALGIYVVGLHSRRLPATFVVEPCRQLADTSWPALRDSFDVALGHSR